ncbi:MAG: hypothetical protein KF796_19785 [Ramlibacter sp.]|nr:hypothetical protein [Ramlibacter sp.]
MKKLQIASVLIALSALGASASAQNAYKCGNTYSQAPCAGGQVVQAQDERTAQQRSDTRSAAQRDAQAAAAMEKERLRQEAQAAPAYIPPTRAQPEAEPARPVMTKPKKPAYFTAIAPDGAKAAKKKKTAKKKAPKEKASKA